MTVSDAGTFLTKILDHKRTEVARQALKIPLAQLQANIAAAPAPRAFDAALRRPGRVALIAEVASIHGPVVTQDFVRNETRGGREHVEMVRTPDRQQDEENREERVANRTEPMYRLAHQ
jgi:hypothetical protein